MNEHAARGPRLGTSMAIGIVATLTLGVLGAFGWLAWVWSKTPSEIRATVSRAKRIVVVAIATGSVAVSVLGLTMTVISLQSAFASVHRAPAADRARLLGVGISEAMNFTAFGMIPLPLAVIVVFVAGYRLLRATAKLTSP